MPENMRTHLGISIERAEQILTELKTLPNVISQEHPEIDHEQDNMDLLTNLVGKFKDPKELAYAVFIAGYGAGSMDQWRGMDVVLGIILPEPMMLSVIDALVEAYHHKLAFLIGEAREPHILKLSECDGCSTPCDMAKKSQPKAPGTQEKAPETKGPKVHISDTKKGKHDANAP